MSVGLLTQYMTEVVVFVFSAFEIKELLSFICPMLLNAPLADSVSTSIAVKMRPRRFWTLLNNQQTLKNKKRSKTWVSEISYNFKNVNTKSIF